MALNNYQQFEKLLQASNHVLIVLPESPSGDLLGAGYGLAHILTQYGQETSVAFTDPNDATKLFAFLPRPKKVLHSLCGVRDFVLHFKTKHNDILNVATKRDDDALHIHVTPEKGMIDTRDFSFELAPFPYDMIIMIGCATKESPGKLYADMPDIFYDVPIVNIDNTSANEQFGQINFVTITASSCSEVVLDLCTHIVGYTLTPEAAECFLTGIIVATDSFRAPHTTPMALSYAGEMIDHGADQQKIVTHLYKSQPLRVVRLWGRILSNLEADTQHHIVTTTISQKDFDATETGPEYLPMMSDKIKQIHATAQVIIILYEKDNAIMALVDATELYNLPQTLQEDPEASLHHITLDAPSLEDAREHVLKLLRN